MTNQNKTGARASLVALMVKNPLANAGNIIRYRFDSWTRKIPWRRKWQPTPVFLPEKLYGQRSLTAYNPWDCKESNIFYPSIDGHWGHSSNLELSIPFAENFPDLWKQADHAGLNFTALFLSSC